VLRGLELGANDYLTRPIDRNELLARRSFTRIDCASPCSNR
jgi:DNA-binding response OmpR family regulator